MGRLEQRIRRAVTRARKAGVLAGVWLNNEDIVQYFLHNPRMFAYWQRREGGKA